MYPEAIGSSDDTRASLIINKVDVRFAIYTNTTIGRCSPRSIHLLPRLPNAGANPVVRVNCLRSRAIYRLEDKRSE